jgi:hypothetical protein
LLSKKSGPSDLIEGAAVVSSPNPMQRLAADGQAWSSISITISTRDKSRKQSPVDPAVRVAEIIRIRT